MNPTQNRVFNELLAIGGDRPYSHATLAGHLRDRIIRGTAKAMSAWTEKTMWLTKAQINAALGCEAAMLADRVSGAPTTPMHPATAVGLVVHRAIQMSYTHPSVTVHELVTESVVGCRLEEKFATFWASSAPAAQSDVIVAATSRVTGFLDSWPRLHPTWAPRFEEPVQAKVGGLTLSTRMDLLLGRPRADGRQTMLISDWKSGALREEHYDEAQFYALVATLRFGVPPFRSAIFSLASGEWSDPDVTVESLTAAADRVIAAVVATVDVLTDARPATYTTSRACTWCPQAATCDAFAESLIAPATLPVRKPPEAAVA